MKSKTVLFFVLSSLVMLSLFTMSCAGTENQQTVSKIGHIKIYEQIDWEKEIEAYNADPGTEIKYVCKKITPTGSHIPRMTCQTTAQIENRRKQDQRRFEDFLRRN